MALFNIKDQKAAYFSATVSAHCFVKATNEIAADGLISVQAAGAGEMAIGAVQAIMTAGVTRRYAPSGYGNRVSILLATSTCSPGDLIMAASGGTGKKLAVATTTSPVYCNAIALENGSTGTYVLVELIAPFKVADKN